MRRPARFANRVLACTVMMAVVLTACGATDTEAPAAAPDGAAAVTPAPSATLGAAGDPATTPAPPSGPAPATTAPSSPMAPVSSGVPETPQALRFTAPLVGGGELDLATLSGQPVLFWFWAPY